MIWIAIFSENDTTLKIPGRKRIYFLICLFSLLLLLLQLLFLIFLYLLISNTIIHIISLIPLPIQQTQKWFLGKWDQGRDGGTDLFLLILRARQHAKSERPEQWCRYKCLRDVVGQCILGIHIGLVGMCLIRWIMRFRDSPMRDWLVVN